MILASAIRLYIEKTKTAVVLCGARHGHIFEQIEAMGFEPKEGYKEIEQGFITHEGNFLNREEAYKHAKECGQLASKIIYERESNKGYKLISEDLW